MPKLHTLNASTCDENENQVNWNKRWMHSQKFTRYFFFACVGFFFFLWKKFAQFIFRVMCRVGSRICVNGRGNGCLCQANKFNFSYPTKNMVVRVQMKRKCSQMIKISNHSTLVEEMVAFQIDYMNTGTSIYINDR